MTCFSLSPKMVFLLKTRAAIREYQVERKIARAADDVGADHMVEAVHSILRLTVKRLDDADARDEVESPEMESAGQVRSEIARGR